MRARVQAALMRPEQIRSRVVCRRVAACTRKRSSRAGHNNMLCILLKGGRRKRQRRLALACWAAVLASTSAAVAAEADPPSAGDEPVIASPPPEPATPGPAAPPPADAKAEPKPPLDIEVAVGPMLAFRPEYQGAAHWGTTLDLGVFVRWGRFTITNASGFVTRRDDDVMRGLAADLVRTDNWRANLALRIDNGRTSKDSAALTGLPDIERTVRGRLLVTRSFPDNWGATLGVSADLLGRGGGTLVDFGPSHDIPIALGEPWRKSRISLGMAFTAADRRYMQSYFGITPQQAAITGYPEYTPGAGLRDVSVGIALRSYYGERWVGYIGSSASHLLGPALASPLTQRSNSWSINGGVAYRFF